VSDSKIEVEREEIPIITFYKVLEDNGKHSLRVRQHNDSRNAWELSAFLRAYLEVLELDNRDFMEFYDDE